MEDGQGEGKVFGEDEGGDRARMLVVGDMRPSESGALLCALSAFLAKWKGISMGAMGWVRSPSRRSCVLAGSSIIVTTATLITS